MKPNMKQIKNLMGKKTKVFKTIKNNTYQRFLDTTTDKVKEQQKRIDKNLELQKKQQQQRNRGLLY